MPETYIVTVKTGDGKCLIQRKITGNVFSLSYHLSQLANHLVSPSADTEKSETSLGSGTQ